MGIKLRPFPHYLRYVESLAGSVWGKANGPVITIEHDAPDYVYAHELEHVKQWYITLGLHGMLYKTSKTYQYRSELAAYVRSVRSGRTIQSAALALSGDAYDFKISFKEALNELHEALNEQY